MKNLSYRYILPLALIAILSGCASHYAPGSYSDPYGFFSGIWHGIIFPYALLTNIVSWCLSLIGISFLADIQILGRPNTGFFYYTGFAIGFFCYGGAAR